MSELTVEELFQALIESAEEAESPIASGDSLDVPFADIGYDSALYSYNGDSLAVPGQETIGILLRTRPECGFLTAPGRTDPPPPRYLS